MLHRKAGNPRTRNRYYKRKDKSGYQVKSGTSMAAPVVSGALALAFEKYPSFTPAEMKLRLYERAYPRSAQLGRIGWGMIHVDHLVR